MYIYLWFFIIAALALIINIVLLLQMKRKKKSHLSPVVCVLAGSYLLAGCLYAATVSHGTDVLSHTLAASFSIDAASYETVSQNGQTLYRFHCDNGIPLEFDETSLLADVTAASDEVPETVDVYSCQVRTGFDWCYLSQGTQVRYALH